jgi:hypothetical protein
MGRTPVIDLTLVLGYVAARRKRRMHASIALRDRTVVRGAFSRKIRAPMSKGHACRSREKSFARTS